MTMLIPLALLQVGPWPTEIPIDPLPIPRRETRTESPAQQAVPAASTRLGQCFAETRRDVAAARVLAEAWLTEGNQPALANRCLGVAPAAGGEWGAAYNAFIAARDATDATEPAGRARLGALAGNAALAAGDDAGALPALITAQADALAGGDAALAASLGLDRATALVGMGREAEAVDALDRARADDPDNGQAWLLSATLSRRLDNLDLAQQPIVEAGRLLPGDPLGGLEAGVIAVLAGQDEAARRSWQSVVDLAPDSDAAATARDYLLQLEDE